MSEELEPIKNNEIVLSSDITIKDMFSHLVLNILPFDEAKIVLANATEKILDLCEIDLPEDDRAKDAFEAIKEYNEGNLLPHELYFRRNGVAYAAEDYYDATGKNSRPLLAITALATSITLYNSNIKSGYDHEKALESAKSPMKVTIDHLFKIINTEGNETYKLTVEKHIINLGIEKKLPSVNKFLENGNNE